VLISVIIVLLGRDGDITLCSLTYFPFFYLMTSLPHRNSISATLSALPRTDDKASTVTSNSEKGGGGSGTEECSIGSAGSLAKRNQHNTEGLPWDDEDVESGKSVKLIYLLKNKQY
jgi:hypothetical protein